MPDPNVPVYVPPTRLPAHRVTARALQDTVAGCESLAASDLARAALTDTENGRRKFQLSAETWQQRATLLLRIQTSFDKRQALDKAEWERADAAELLVGNIERTDDVWI